jgi:hypothetical protein
VMKVFAAGAAGAVGTRTVMPLLAEKEKMT